MFAFRVGPIPVQVHPSHLLVAGFIGWSFAQSHGERPWPAVILRDPSHPSYYVTSAFVLLTWTLLVSLSVLVHELGHAAAARRFGLQPRVDLVGLGGMTSAPDSAGLPWWKDLVFTLAGPAAGLALGAVAGLPVWAKGAALPDPVHYFASGVALANVAWTVLNLLPMGTLDGGRAATTVLTRFFGRGGYLAAQVLSLALVAGGLAWAVKSASPMLGLIVVMMGTRSVQNLLAWFRGEPLAGEAPHPMEAVQARAEALYQEGKLAEAELVAKDVAASDAPASLRGRSHYLLGWLALKEGAGRRALDHFAQVQGLEVPPHAQAAAFSLIGDEARALPLWAKAAKTMEDEVVLHEFAGALLRSGQEREARELPGVRPVQAYMAAERVYFLRREYEQAAHMAESAFREEQHPVLAYDAACAWALAGRPDDAMRMLALARQNGFRDVATAVRDPDLRSLRDRPDFQQWLGLLAQSTPS